MPSLFQFKSVSAVFLISFFHPHLAFASSCVLWSSQPLARARAGVLKWRAERREHSVLRSHSQQICVESLWAHCLLCSPPAWTPETAFCPHSVFMGFVWIWEQTAIISLYSINWLVFITETESVYCAVRTGSLYNTSLTFSNSTFCHTVYLCVLCGSENKQRLFPYTTLIDYFFITETENIYCAVRTGASYVGLYQVSLAIYAACLLPRVSVYRKHILLFIKQLTF
jgi:hypothetical protein